ncbi:MAG: HAMP domain-containing protein [Gammaproteobacteria bacterium]|nr:HAMP domain-containing protein [Gammaproteobacteria bacterium]MBT5202826.1 HAMP domain-containing protein [Gammaproteobacteria bacterium]MBT5603519.1 HAMP domain-containing protein [Gammaproteobacteria bacterium]MBT6244166.1 HAMP domain-containing protein [Gammaproteobacteria bacterium]
MDIRTKLSLLLVAVSLISMGLLGAFAYRTSAGMLQEISIRQLDALAEGKKRDLLKVQQNWRRTIHLLTRHVVSQGRFNGIISSEKTAASQTLMNLISLYAEVNGIASVKIFDATGAEWVTVGQPSLAKQHLMPSTDIEYRGTIVTDAQAVQVVMAARIIDQGKLVGGLELTYDARDLISIAENLTGLGTTGEVLMFSGGLEGSAVTLLSRRRHIGAVQQGQKLEFAEMSADIQAALKNDVEPSSQVMDDRGQLVWMASRYIPELEWGLVVKVDASEEEVRSELLLTALVDIGLSVSAFAILGGALLGLYFARPVQQLVDVVQRFNAGENDVRATIQGDDEITYLAATLNDYLDTVSSPSKRTDDA